MNRKIFLAGCQLFVTRIFLLVLNYPFIFSNIKHELFADIIALTLSYHVHMPTTESG